MSENEGMSGICDPFQADQYGETAFSKALENRDSLLAKKYIISSASTRKLFSDDIISSEDNVAFCISLLKGLYQGDCPLQAGLFGSNACAAQVVAVRECGRAAIDFISDDISTVELLAAIPELAQ